VGLGWENKKPDSEESGSGGGGFLFWRFLVGHRRSSFTPSRRNHRPSAFAGGQDGHRGHNAKVGGKNHGRVDAEFSGGVQAGIFREAKADG
jgi:hypothetical protein